MTQASYDAVACTDGVPVYLCIGVGGGGENSGRVQGKRRGKRLAILTLQMQPSSRNALISPRVGLNIESLGIILNKILRVHMADASCNHSTDRQVRCTPHGNARMVLRHVSLRI